MIRITNSISIPEDELLITASRSSGPGGQNVNKVSTKVTLRFNLANTGRLTDGQKARVRARLKNIINREGCLVLHDETGRSQAANRKRVTAKFAALMAKALAVHKKRVPTKASQTQKRKRLDEKKIRGRKKEARKKVTDLE